MKGRIAQLVFQGLSGIRIVKLGVRVSEKEEELGCENAIIAAMQYLHLEALQGDRPELARVIGRAIDEWRFLCSGDGEGSDGTIVELSSELIEGSN